ncbi:MAG: hypothetical protein ACFCU4_06815 [Puniceicoccaceae bacterium]
MIAVSRAFDPQDDLLSFNPTASPRLRAIPNRAPQRSLPLSEIRNSPSAICSAKLSNTTLNELKAEIDDEEAEESDLANPEK